MKIPVGNFGQAVADPQQAANLPAGTADTATAREVQGIAAQVGGIGQDLLETQRRAQDLRRMADTENALGALQDEIGQGLQTGKIDPAKAQAVYQQRAREIIGSQVRGASPLYQGAVQAQLEGVAGRVGGRVRDMATRQVQLNIGGELTALGVALEREPDPATASRRYEAAVRNMGPLAGMTPAQIEGTVNTFREKAYSTKAYSMLSAARNNMGALDQVQKALASDEFAALDPQRRATLIAQADGYKLTLEQRAVAAAQRQELQAQARERKAGQVYGNLFKMATEGLKIDPEYAAQATQAVAGTSYEGMLPAVLQAAPAGAAFATQPAPVRAEILRRMTAEGNRNGWTPEARDRFETLQQADNAARQGARQDPLNAAADRGVIEEVAPLDLAGGLPSLVEGLGRRTAQAAVVEQWNGGMPVSPLTAAEASQVADLLGALPTDQKATAMADLHKVVGSRTMGAIAGQLNGKDRALALAAGLGDQRTDDGGLVAQSVLRGEQVIKDKRVTEGETSLWRRQIAEKVRGSMASPEVEDAVIDAAILARASGQAGGKRLSIDEAIKVVAGEIVERNGTRIPLPRGMDSSDFGKALKNAVPSMIQTPTPDGKVYSGGQAIPVEDFLAKLRDAPLRHAGPGLYTVSAGSGSVLNAEGLPVLITVSGQPAAEKGGKNGTR